MAKIVKKAKATVTKKKAATPKKGSSSKSAPVKAKKVASKPAPKKVVTKASSTKKKAPVKSTSKKTVAKVTTKKTPTKKVVAKKVVSKGKSPAKVTPKTIAKTKKPSSTSSKKVVKKVIVKHKTPVVKVKAKNPVVVEKTKGKVLVEKTTASAKPVQKGKVKSGLEVKKQVPEKGSNASTAGTLARPTRPAKDLPRKKMSLRNIISDEVSFDMPAPKKNKVMTLSKEEKMKIKKMLLSKCIEIQKNNVAMAKKAMEEAQESANSERTSEDMSESFRETMQATRDMYARQAHEGTNTLALLNRIMIVQEHEWVKFGSVIITDYQNYFISSGLGEITINDESFITVSTLSPLFQILASKQKGAQFMFLDRMYKVLEVF